MLGGSGFRGELDIFAEKQAENTIKVHCLKLDLILKKLTITTPDLNNKIKQTKCNFLY